jgi:DNA-binding ferritin-like protein
MAGTTPTPEEAHAKLMGDPHYAVHIHERQLEQLAKMIEEIAERLISLEKKVIDMEQAQMGVDDNNPIVNYPEVQMHQKR